MPESSVSQLKNGRRVAIIHGLRTPFAKPGTSFKNLTSLDLGKIVTVELLNRTEIEPSEIDRVIFGNVRTLVRTQNIAREISLGSGIPHSSPAFTVSSACVSANQSFSSAVDSIASGEADVVVAGGVDTSNEIHSIYNKTLRSKSLRAGGGLIQKARPLLRIGAEDEPESLSFVPERSTGMTLGEFAETIARRYKLTRDEQDEFALRSHTLASRARDEGVFEDEVIHTFIPPDFEDFLSTDNGVADELTSESLAEMDPLFDREFGTVTAGNSSYLSDGASVLLLASEEKAKSMGYKPLAYVKSYAYSAVDPMSELLMSPAYATDKALERAGISLSEIDLVEIHEAFASQVISNLKALGSKAFAKENLGKMQPVGEVDPERINVSGGSIAIGHPPAATGIRLITTLVCRMAKRRGNFGLVMLPAAGGLGFSLVTEKQ
jgi:acetyl-CoA acyltransferase